MQARDFDAYRPHAEATSALTLSLPPTLSSAPREDTIKAMNRLRLTMYINHVDSSKPTLDIIDDAAAIKAWIETHTPEVQVFLNALGAGIPEDGIRGDLTVNCIQKLLGITTVSVLVTPEPPVTGVIVPPVTTTILRPVARPTDSDDTVSDDDTAEDHEIADNEMVIDLPAHMQDEAEARAALEALGIEGLRIVNGQLIGIRDLNTQNKIEKLCQYLEYANYLEAGDIDAEGVMRRYRELLDYPTNFIQDKKYLIMKYASAIYDEITKSGHHVRLDEDGKYTILDAKEETITDHPYQDFITGNIESKREYIEFARLNAIVGNSSMFWNERLVTRVGLVEHILQKNTIISTSLANAGLPDIQSVEALLINKDDVIATLQTKLDASSTSDEQQELSWLLDFLVHEQYKQNTQQSLFHNLNHYNDVFEAEHSFIDALTAEGLDPTTATPEDEGFVNAAQRVLGENTIPIVLLSLVTMLFGGAYKGWGVKGLFGLLAAKVGLGIAESTMEEVEAANDDGSILGDAFDIYNPADLKHRINYPAGFERADYDPKLSALYDANKVRRSSGEVVAGVPVFQATNAKVGAIFQGVMGQDSLLGLDIQSGDTGTLADTILGIIPTNIDDTTFLSTIPSDQHGTITREDIIVFLELTREKMESGDKTLGDALLEGASVVSSGYKNINFTIDNNFDLAINSLLRTEWEKAIPIVQVGGVGPSVSIAQATEVRNAILELGTILKSNLSNGPFDGIADMTNTLDFATFNRGLTEQVGDINTLISTVNANTDIPTALRDKFTNNADGILPDLIRYHKSSTQMAEYETGVVGDTTDFLSSIIPGTDITVIDTQIADINTMITKLDISNFDAQGEIINLTRSNVFDAIEARVNNRKQELNTKKAELEAKKLELQGVTDTTTLVAKTAFLDAATRFRTAIGVNKIQHLFGTFSQEDNIQLLQNAWNGVGSVAPTPGTPERTIYDALKPIFETGGEMVTLQGEIEIAFEEYYAENERIITDEITPIPSTFSNITDVITARTTLAQILTRYEDSDEITTGQSFKAFITQGVPISKTEGYYNEAISIFPSLSVTNNTHTLASVAAAAIEKQEDIALAAYNEISGISTYDEINFNLLNQMSDLGIVDFIDEMNIGADDISTVFGEKYTNATNGFLRAIPATPVGIGKLQHFKDTHLGTPGIIATISVWWSGASTIQSTFETQVQNIGATILRNDFSENTLGLQKIIQFGKTGSEFGFIKENYPNFEQNYKNRVEEIATSVINSHTDDFTGLTQLTIFKSSPEYRDAEQLGNPLTVAFDSKVEQIRQTVVRSTNTPNADLTLNGRTLQELIDVLDSSYVVPSSAPSSTHKLHTFRSYIAVNNGNPQTLEALLNTLGLTIDSSRPSSDVDGEQQIHDFLSDINIIK